MARRRSVSNARSKPIKARGDEKVVLLSGGNPQIAKSEGDAPVPAGGTAKEARWIDLHEDDLDEAQLAAWVKQAVALPGWDPRRTS